MGRRVHHLLTVGAGYKEGIESQIHNWLILKSWDILDGRHSTARSWKRNKENENSRDLNSVPRITNNYLRGTYPLMIYDYKRSRDQDRRVHAS